MNQGTIMFNSIDNCAVELPQKRIDGWLRPTDVPNTHATEPLGALMKCGKRMPVTVKWIKTPSAWAYNREPKPSFTSLRHFDAKRRNKL
ncbi:hypothetical protein BBBOND_0200690 [Babesia bigemina]|uniref:Uncharacterized protein n=1 Tax=Babesia bigemina TaxID=5866 RepID=A0A061D4D4_BABBI|nr:hypothetical protein BBBOND_0200690 [Babesia bigemina]CDR94912.1 hypothetical protein BBBOND_0200690 [Babesia bigemina]|eukprot:XP_012767098.1 hypothetical protein BBBOND_0200690 [Babesia bigemina]